jgi:hypothetical protein
MTEEYVIVPVGSQHCDVFIDNWQFLCDFFWGDTTAFYLSACEMYQARKKDRETKYVLPRNMYNLIDRCIKKSQE